MLFSIQAIVRKIYYAPEQYLRNPYHESFVMNSLLPTIFPVTNQLCKVGQGSTFFAVSGYKTSGSFFIEQAIAQGATKIVAEESEKEIIQKIENRYPHVQFSYSATIRKELALTASNAAGNPTQKLKIIGITGTKGKSTTTHIIKHILDTAGYRTALIGGIKNYILNTSETSCLTTPDSDYLQQFFAQCVLQKIDYVIMEVSSHALSLDRTYTIPFSHVGFTNLAPEHLDFYTSMDDYFSAKKLLLNQVIPNGSVHINNEDTWGNLFAQSAPDNTQTWTFNEGISQKKHHHTITFTSNFSGLAITLTSTNKNVNLISHNLFGRFNAYNISMSYSIAQSIGISDDNIIKAIATFAGTPGRLQLHTLANGAKCFVDYAHNPSSMEAILQTLRPLSSDLIVIFGCGGDRDTTKRPVMGSLAEHYADTIIITNDNPRTEDPEKIIAAILSGISYTTQKHIKVIPDRAQAIAYSAFISTPHSIIALLGKGHENYLLIGTQKLFFDDFAQIKQF